MTTTALRKIGLNRGKPRLWIEGKALVDAGLDHGNRWNLVPLSETSFAIVGTPEGKRKIAGKPGRPIIDIVGATVSRFGFAHGDEAKLTFEPGSGRIEVSRA